MAAGKPQHKAEGIAWPAFPPGTDAQRAVVEGITRRLHGDDRVLVAWLTGSFGRGDADAWSDVDLEAMASDEGLAGLAGELDALHAAGGQVALQWPSVAEHCFHNGVFYETCVILDLRVTRRSALLARPDPATVHVLFDKVGAFAEARVPAEAPLLAPEQSAQEVGRRCEFFWVYAYTAGRFLKRGDVGLAAGYLSTMRGVLAQILWMEVHPREWLPWMAGWGPVRTDLPLAQRRALADTHPEAERAGLGQALRHAVAESVPHLRRIARAAGAPYPEAVERAVLGYLGGGRQP